MGHFLSGWWQRWRARHPRQTRRALPTGRRWWRAIRRGLGIVAAVFVLTSLLLVLVLRWLPVPTSSVIAHQWLKSWWQGQDTELHYNWVAYRDISPYAALAVMAGEDQRFPNHHGFDFIEIRDALDDLDEGKPLRGASTLSQQVAKNLFLWSDRSFVRKGLEIWFTLLLELLWPKERILEVYLNIAEFGDATFGVEAASRRFFNKAAAGLTLGEAARLAAVLPNPVRYRVDRPSAYVLKRQRWIEQQMRQLGGTRYLDRL